MIRKILYRGYKVLCFLPSAIVFSYLAFIFIFLQAGTSFGSYLRALFVLGVFLISDLMLYQHRWFGALPALAYGIYLFIGAFQNHGQIFDERPIYLILCIYYLLGSIVAAVIRYKQKKNL